MKKAKLIFGALGVIMTAFLSAKAKAQSMKDIAYRMETTDGESYLSSEGELLWTCELTHVEELKLTYKNYIRTVLVGLLTIYLLKGETI